jgi:pyridoxine 5-phosphate synthase
MKRKIRLGVNIDHAATLRQVRGGTTPYPNILNIVRLAERGGADQITIHLREDRRHIQEKDLALLAGQTKVALNLEMAATWEMVRLARIPS